MQRPYYPKYPGHTLNYFELQIIKAFLSGATIFISEDSYDSSEEEEFPKVLPRRCLRAKTDSKVIVGIAIVAGLGQGTLTDDDRAYLKHRKESIVVLDHDKDMEAVKSYIDQTEVAKLEYFEGCQLKVDTLVVGGPYMDRGHGTSLLTACTNLADSCVARMAGSFTPWSREIARKSGFDIKDLPVKYKDSSFTMGLGVREPR
ncbi:hypothetical protein AOQ84DRAFT_43430 [Glonium stellatum]|uniref:Uncharacterized protein n=1 Tax=Glonium stellatum TaxID=574774 RepID=A0A8E2JST1_9PEZI|nr:hypothetical protein AOQ84DRAFT_43430 [Glonium stellatum]